MQGARPEAGTKSLIDEMLWHCRREKPSFGLGALCLGAEALVPEMYKSIINGFMANGVDLADIEFFRIHVECDDGHAETVRDIMVRIAEADPSQLELMVAAVQRLVDARLKLFSGVEQRAAQESVRAA